jgi:hypothetical protein
MLNGASCPSEEIFYRLRSAGLLSGHTAEDAAWRCRVYPAFLTRHLV